eukprot:5197939-Amphidinium_carterae.2
MSLNNVIESTEGMNIVACDPVLIQNSPTSSYGLGHLPLQLADWRSPTNMCKRCILVMDDLPARPDMDSILVALQGRTVPEVAVFSCNCLLAHVVMRPEPQECSAFNRYCAPCTVPKQVWREETTVKHKCPTRLHRTADFRATPVCSRSEQPPETVAHQFWKTPQTAVIEILANMPGSAKDVSDLNITMADCLRDFPRNYQRMPYACDKDQALEYQPLVVKDLGL